MPRFHFSGPSLGQFQIVGANNEGRTSCENISWFFVVAHVLVDLKFYHSGDASKGDLWVGPKDNPKYKIPPIWFRRVCADHLESR